MRKVLVQGTFLAILVVAGFLIYDHRNTLVSLWNDFNGTKSNPAPKGGVGYTPVVPDKRP